MRLSFNKFQTFSALIFSSILVCAMPSYDAFSTPTQTNSNTYENILYQVYLKYPKDWVHSERQAPNCGMWFNFCVIFYQTGSDITGIAPINPYNIIHLGIMRASSLNLEQVYGTIIQTNQAMNPYFQFFPSQSGVIDFKNNTAYKAVYIPGYDAPLFTDISIMDNGFVYAISYNQNLADSNDRFRQTLNQILESFTTG
jgi:hypothetical protein